MKTIIENLGIRKEQMLSREHLKYIRGGASADLHCQCIGSVGTWYYPGTSNGDTSHINFNQDIRNNCASGEGYCAFSVM
jgi:hypothetical protein